MSTTVAMKIYINVETEETRLLRDIIIKKGLKPLNCANVRMVKNIPEDKEMKIADILKAELPKNTKVTNLGTLQKF